MDTQSTRECHPCRPSFMRTTSSRLLPRRARQPQPQVTSRSSFSASKNPSTSSDVRLQPQAQLKSIPDRAKYHTRTIWLFTRSDLKTVVFPSTVFALVNAIATARLGMSSTSTTTIIQILLRTPLALLYTWINLLPFAIDNQRQQSAIEEDGENKPWRPLPSGRLDSGQAKWLMFVCYAIDLFMSSWLGAPMQSIALVVFGFAYNDLHGADVGPVVRNLINGFGYVCFASGALQVMLNGEDDAIRALEWWLGVIFMIVCTTVQSQDMYDQVGDALRERRTLPLVVGDGVARYTIIVPVAVWSVFCPWVWDCSVTGYLTVVGLGLVVIARTLLKRSVDADKRTFRLWNLWLTAVYCIPLIKSLHLA